MLKTKSRPALGIRSAVAVLASGALIAAGIAGFSVPALATEFSPSPAVNPATSTTMDVDADTDASNTLFVSAYMGPNAPVSGAQVTVTDRDDQVVASATTTQGGMAMLRGVNVAAASLPLTVRALGGRANGEVFNGKLTGFVWPATTGPTTVNIDFITSAASRFYLQRQQPRSLNSWNARIQQIRDAMGIPEDRAANLLTARNNYVATYRIVRASRPERAKAPRSYNGLVGAAKKAAAGNRPFNRLKPTNPSVSAGTRAASAAAASDDVLCNSQLPNSPSGGVSSTELIVQAGALSAAGLLEVAGVPSSVASGLPGLVLAGLGVTSDAPDDANIKAVAAQLECISAQINALQVLAQTQAMVEAMAPANACRTQVASGWLRYSGLTQAALPITISDVTGVAGSQSITLPGTTGYTNIYPGYSVEGPGIGLETFTEPGMTGDAGEVTLTLTGSNPGIEPGMIVTGSGIGTTDDTPVVVERVYVNATNTQVALSAANSGAVSGVDFSTNVQVLAVTTSGSNTVVSVTGANVGEVAGDIDFRMLLNNKNDDLAKAADSWASLVDGCGGAVSDSVFRPSVPGAKTGWQWMATNVYTASGADTAKSIDMGQIQALQQFLADWGMVHYQQFVLTSEANNYAGTLTLQEAEAGVDQENPAFCAPGSTVNIWTYCVGTNNFITATPPSLYSDERGLVHSAGGGDAVSAVPMGMSAYEPGGVTNCTSKTPAPAGQRAVTAAWFYCQTGGKNTVFDTFPSVQTAALTYANSLPLQTSGENTAVQAWNNPRVYHPIQPTNAQMAPLEITDFVTGLAQASPNELGGQPVSLLAGPTKPRVDQVNPLVYFGAVVGIDTYPWKGAEFEECPCLIQAMGRPWWPGAADAPTWLPSDPARP